MTLAALERVERELSRRIAAVVFLGGEEKVRDASCFDSLGVPVYSGGGQVADLRRALENHDADVVLDLSDEPVVGYLERFRLISEALAMGVSYRGADFRFDAPALPYACSRPSIGVWGTGKRVGKTAVSGYAARLLEHKGSRPCVCTMGRGGPAEPELLGVPGEITDGYLRRRALEGSHAASDHFEDAMMGGVMTVGCRRCGGGMAGAPFFSNVPRGVELACRQDAGIVLFEGSGAAIPPVGVDAVMLVASAAQPLDYLLGYLGPYRLLRSDLLVVTMCEEFLVSNKKLRKLIDGVHAINPEVTVVKTVFRPRPLGEVRGREVYLVSTAPPEAAAVQAEHLSRDHGARVLGFSPNLALRSRLAEDLEGARAAEVLVTELKAAGVDTVSLFAKENGKELIYLENLPVATDEDLEDEIDKLEEKARARFKGRNEEPCGVEEA